MSDVAVSTKGIGSGTPESIVESTLKPVLDLLAGAPQRQLMHPCDMIQRHGEDQFSRFPSKHKFLFHVGAGLALQGWSDSWVSPTKYGIELTLNGKPIPESIYKEFSVSTGRDLYDCVVNEVQRRLEGGQLTKTRKQELKELVMNPTADPGSVRTLALIDQAVDSAQATRWKGSESNYRHLAGRGYLLGLSDLDEQLPFSCLSSSERISIGVSKNHRGCFVEIGRHLPGSGAFFSMLTIDGAPAERIFAEVSSRVGALENKIDAERQLIEEGIVTAVTQGPMQDWKVGWFGSSIEIRGRVGSFEVLFSAEARSSFDGIRALTEPKARAYTQVGPNFVEAKVPSQDGIQALQTILDGRGDIGAALVSKFDESSPLGKHLLSEIERKLRSFTIADLHEHHSYRHPNRTSWAICTNKERKEDIVLSEDGISVGCFTGGQSGGYTTAFQFTSPEAVAIAQAALARVQEINTGLAVQERALKEDFARVVRETPGWDLVRQYGEPREITNKVGDYDVTLLISRHPSPRGKSGEVELVSPGAAYVGAKTGGFFGRTVEVSREDAAKAVEELLKSGAISGIALAPQSPGTVAV